MPSRGRPIMTVMATDSEQKEPEVTPRQLAVPAALVSLFAPGVGHLLIGLRARALTWFAGYVALTLLVGLTRPGVTLVLSLIVAVDAYVLARTAPPTEATGNDEASASQARR